MSNQERQDIRKQRTAQPLKLTKEGFIGPNFVLMACMVPNRKMGVVKNYGQDNKKRRVILDNLLRICCICFGGVDGASYPRPTFANIRQQILAGGSYPLQACMFSTYLGNIIITKQHKPVD